jgi:hypothetical protein
MRAVLLSAVLAGAAASPAVALPDWAAGKTGVWTVEPVTEGGQLCTLDLTANEAIGGLQVAVSAGCRKNHNFEDVAAWTVGQDGTLRLIDPLRHTRWTFGRAPDGVWIGQEEDGDQVVLSRGDRRQATKVSAKARMSGTWSLSGPNNANACGFWMTSNKAGAAGTVKQAGLCPAEWKAKAWAGWTLKAGRLSLNDKAGKPLLVLKQADATTFTTEGEPELFFGPGVIVSP